MPQHDGTNQQPVIDIPRLIEQLDVLRKNGALTEAEFQEKKNKLLSRL